MSLSAFYTHGACTSCPAATRQRIWQWPNVLDHRCPSIRSPGTGQRLCRSNEVLDSYCRCVYRSVQTGNCSGFNALRKRPGGSEHCLGSETLILTDGKLQGRWEGPAASELDPHGKLLALTSNRLPDI